MGGRARTITRPRRRASSQRMLVGGARGYARALADGRPSHRCAVERSSHGEAVVRGKSAVRAATCRSCRRRASRSSAGAWSSSHGHTAAALVYGRGLHTINLFIWPSTSRTTAVRPPSYDGYSLVHWTDHDLSYWAVSDAGALELDAFERAYHRSADAITGLDGAAVPPTSSRARRLVPGFAAASRSASSFATTLSCSS